MSALQRVINRLACLHPKEIDLGLERVSVLLEKLGNPQKKLPSVVHVAGTNGKGSTIAFLKEFLVNQGKSVHTYTSPHLVRFNERIRLNGNEIDDKRLTDCLLRVEKLNDKAPVTFFESVTAASFLAFSETPADFLLLETGMGGRLDATNVVEKPACCVITSLSMDHEGYLGDSLEKIATEKAGILKQNRPVVVAKSSQRALDVLEKKAVEKKCPLILEGRDWHVRSVEKGFYIDDVFYDAPFLLGEHQYQNAGLAMAVLKELENQKKAVFSKEICQKGLKETRWPGRLEKINNKNLPFQGEIWLDGGHNPGAGDVLASFLPCWKDQPFHLICGMLTTKNATEFLSKIVPFAQSFYAVPVNGGTAPGIEPKALAGLAGAYTKSVYTAKDVFDALSLLKKQKGRVLICGSLYLIGEFLKNLKEKQSERIL